jgi:hypothetical protein
MLACMQPVETFLCCLSACYLDVAMGPMMPPDTDKMHVALSRSAPPSSESLPPVERRC